MIRRHEGEPLSPTPEFNLPRIDGDFEGKHIVSLEQFDINSLDYLFYQVPTMKEIALDRQESHLLKGDIVTHVFYEPSTRTRVSFQASVEQLGGRAIIVENPQAFSSVSKGESFEDTIRTLAAYCDAIVLRHPEEGFAKKAAEVVNGIIPIINAGDGVGEHPSQALLDLFTVSEHAGKLNGLTGVMAGDIKNGRTVHSLMRGLALYPGNTVYLLSPNQLRLNPKDLEDMKRKGLSIIEIDNPDDMPINADFWYWTRVQKERFENEEEYNAVNNRFIADQALLDKKGGPNTILMHPLPRVGEIPYEVDKDPRAVYLRSQVRNGMYVRMALIGLVLGRIK